MNTDIFVKLFQPHFESIKISKERIKKSEVVKEIIEEEEKKIERKRGWGFTFIIIAIIGILIYKKFY